MSCHQEASHAVRDTGAGSQECDAHDDVWDAQGEADDGDLHIMGWSSQCCQKELQFKLSINLTFHRLPREERLCRNFQFKFVVDSSLTNQNINLIGCKKKYTVYNRDRPIYRSADIIGRYSRFLRVSVSADMRPIFADIFFANFFSFLLVLPHLSLIFVKYCSSTCSYLFYLTCFYYLLNIVFYIEVQ